MGREPHGKKNVPFFFARDTRSKTRLEILREFANFGFSGARISEHDCLARQFSREFNFLFFGISRENSPILAWGSRLMCPSHVPCFWPFFFAFPVCAYNPLWRRPAPPRIEPIASDCGFAFFEILGGAGLRGVPNSTSDCNQGGCSCALQVFPLRKLSRWARPGMRAATMPCKPTGGGSASQVSEFCWGSGAFSAPPISLPGVRRQRALLKKRRKWLVFLFQKSPSIRDTLLVPPKCIKIGGTKNEYRTRYKTVIPRAALFHR